MYVLRKIGVVREDEEILVTMARGHVAQIEIELSKLGRLVFVQSRYSSRTEVCKGKILVWIV